MTIPSKAGAQSLSKSVNYLKIKNKPQILLFVRSFNI